MCGRKTGKRFNTLRMERLFYFDQQGLAVSNCYIGADYDRKGCLLASRCNIVDVFGDGKNKC